MNVGDSWEHYLFFILLVMLMATPSSPIHVTRQPHAPDQMGTHEVGFSGGYFCLIAAQRTSPRSSKELPLCPPG